MGTVQARHDVRLTGRKAGKGETKRMKVPSPLRTPLGAALLSALFPGLGQAAAGKPGRGAIVAIPALATLGALGFIVLFYRRDLLDSAFNQAWLTSLLLLDLVALVYHLWAVADSYLLAGRGREVQPGRRRRTTPSPRKWGATIGVAIIVSGTVLVHAGVASVDMQWQGGVQCVKDLGCGIPTFAPGQTVGLDTSDPNVQVVDPSGSGSIASGSSSASPSIGPAGTIDISQLPSFAPTDQSKNWAADGQFNVLLLGVDFEPGSRAQGLRPDTMILLHVDIQSGRAAMISVPRNTMCVPLPLAIGEHYAKSVNGCPVNTWPYMLNWLAGEAGWGVVTGVSAINNFPFYQSPTAGQANDPKAIDRGVEATMEAVSTLTGLTIDGYVMINISGLVTLIDDLGGIDITVPTKVYDNPCGPAGTWESKFRVCAVSPPHDGYQVPPDTADVIARMKADAVQSGGQRTITWSGGTTAAGTDISFVIQPGKQHMNGQWALAYARTRIYTTDYDRSLRQQLVLKSLRGSLNPCALLPRVTSLIKDMQMFKTDLPLTDISKWAGLAQNIVGGNVKSINLDPTTLGNPGVTYINQTTWAKARDVVAHSLDSVPAAAPSGGGGGGGGGGLLSC
jgi:anionic cell wall polymer biosynthesis LytR-Cps2A-Psr (LCP) family protein